MFSLRPAFPRLISCLVFAFTFAPEALALAINSPSAAVNQVFSSGFSTATPVFNTSASFLGNGYDLTGVGWQTDSGLTGSNKRVHALALITPLHFYTASHNYVYPTSVRSNEIYYYTNASGQVFTANVATNYNSFTTALTNDISVGTYTQAFTQSQGVATYRLLDVSTRAYANAAASMLLVGSQVDGNGPLIASAKLDYTVGAYGALSWIAAASGSPAGSASTAEIGDSGSPGFIPYTAPGGIKQLTLAGSHWHTGDLGTPLPYVNGSTYDPVNAINDELKKTGYALKWTIYESTTDTTNTASRWSGAAGTGVFGTGTNWTGNSAPLDTPVLFDASNANNQTTLSVNSAAVVRGMLFKSSASSTGFIFNGTATLGLGATGLRNESSATQTFNAPISLYGSQNWEAAAGPLAVAGTIDTGSGYLLAIGGAQATTLSGVISGSGALAKDDAGLLTLDAVNTYTGKTFLHNGTTRLGAAGNLPATDLVFIAGNSAILDLNGRSQTFSDVRSEYGGAGTIQLGGGTLTIAPTGTTTNVSAATVTGTGTVAKSGAGTWTLAAALAHTGPTQLNAGMLRLATGGALSAQSNLVFGGGVLELGTGDFTQPLGTAAGQVQFSAGGGFGALGGARTVNLGGASAPVTWASGNFVASGGSLILSSSASDSTVTFTNPINFNGAARTVQTDNGTAVIDARLTGALSNGRLTKGGNGVLEVTAASSYSDTRITGGGLLFTGSGTLGTGNLDLNNGVLILSPATGDFTRALGSGSGQVKFTTGGFAAYGGDRVVNLGGSGAGVTWGSTDNFASTLVLGSIAGDSMVDFQNPIDLNSGQRTVAVDNGTAAVDGRLSGALTSATGGLTKTKAGTLELTGTNTYGGSTTVSAGALRIGGANALSPNSNVTLSGGVLELGAGNLTRALGTGAGQLQFISGGGGFSASGANRTVNLGGASAPLVWGTTANFVYNGNTLVLSSVGSDATVDFQNPIDLSASGTNTRTIQVDNGSATVDAILSGTLSQTGTATLTKTGTGTLVLSAANSYSGGTNLNGGTLRIDNASALGSGTISFGGGALQYGSGITTDLSSRFNTAASQTPSVDTNSQNITWGTASTTASLTKSGTGTLTLTAANTVSGTTTINGGTLQVGAGGTTGSLTSGSIVNNGALVYSLDATSTISLPAGGITGSGTVSATAGSILFNGNVVTGGSQSYSATSNGGGYKGGWIKVPSVNLQTTGPGSSISLSGDYGKDFPVANTLNLDTSAGNGTINLNISLGRVNVWYILNGFTANAGTGTINVSGSYVPNGWGTPATLTGGINITSNLVNSGAITLNTTAPSTLTSVISGTGSIVKAGADTLVVTGAQTYTGGTTINNGTLQIGNGGTTGSVTGAIVTHGALVYNLSNTSTATLPANIATPATAGISGNGTVSVTAKNITFNGDVTTAGSQSYNATGTSGLYTGGTINTANVALTTTGANAPLTLTGDYGKQGSTGNTLALDTSAGNSAINLDLSIGRFGTFYPLSAFTAHAGTGPINLLATSTRAATYGWNATSLSLTGALNLAGNLAVSGPLTLNTPADGTLSGNLTNVSGGTASLTKSGNATLTVSGTGNTYSGTTTLTNGTLRLSGVINNASTVEVRSGATLDLAGGTLTTGTLTIRSGGRLIGSGTINATVINEGLVEISGSTSTLTINGAFTNTATGTVRIRSSATLTQSGGAWTNNGFFDRLTASASTTSPSSGTGTALTASVVPPTTEFTFGTTATLTLPTYAGHTYQLQRSTNLASGSWTNLGSAVAGTGGNLTLADPTPPSASAVFYRVAIDF